MTMRIIKPSRVAPNMPPDVAMTVDSGIRRHDQALAGTEADSDEIINSLGGELDRMYDELDGRVTEEVERACYRANTAWMIWKDLRDYAFTEPEDVPTAPDEKFQHALKGMTFAAILRSGVELSAWCESWQNSHYGGIEWPSDTHAVCAAVGSIASSGLGGPQLVLDLAADIHDDAAALLATVPPSPNE